MQSKSREYNPPKWKMAVISWLAIVPLIFTILPTFGPMLCQLGLGNIMVDLVLTTVLVLAMVYLAMPLVMYLLRSWLNQN